MAEPFPSAEVTLSWGSIQLDVTSVQYSQSAAAEVDITSMGVVGGLADTVIEDEEDDRHRLVVKSIDYGVLDPGQISIEYFDLGQLREEHVGKKRRLVVVGSPEDSAPQRFAFLTDRGSQYKVGEFVMATATFKFSDQ